MTHSARLARLPAVVAALGAIVAAAAGPREVSAQQPPEPYRRESQAPLGFPGPGRDEPEPDVAEVVIGWFGPGDPDHPEFGTAWRGALLALDEENAAGGHCPRSGAVGPTSQCKPFRLVPAWSESPWHAGIGQLLRLVYEQRAWAVIGGIDGAATHLAVQVSLKARVLLLSPGSTDVTADRANVPWLFSLPPSDEAIARAMVATLTSRGHARFAIAAATDHSTHATLVALQRELNRQRLAPTALVEFDGSAADVREVAARLTVDRPDAVVVLAPAPTAGSLVGGLRHTGFSGTIVGGPSVAGLAFRRAAGAAAENVLAPSSIEPGPRWDAFSASYERRWATPPDELAAGGYDAVQLVAAAVRRAGLNRVRIRDALRDLAPWEGAAGTARWDARGRNDRPVVLARWQDGQLVATESRRNPN